ncbi:hypothetical protein [Pseudalkalibacillus caeni]|uniref:Uncharacterized protein n=1 Tax=Exobacillus caeni TaxID=2574798 RepID=A0A5R9F5C3_9BACL|nr:hypothetical protein [Pseudalkalibacillus caeni]TLS38231.1 hypothetical protein FCL54_06765 [Pseudalkalibacillus caeni]
MEALIAGGGLKVLYLSMGALLAVIGFFGWRGVLGCLARPAAIIVGLLGLLLLGLGLFAGGLLASLSSLLAVIALFLLVLSIFLLSGVELSCSRLLGLLFLLIALFLALLLL